MHETYSKLADTPQMVYTRVSCGNSFFEKLCILTDRRVEGGGSFCFATVEENETFFSSQSVVFLSTDRGIIIHRLIIFRRVGDVQWQQTTC